MPVFDFLNLGNSSKLVKLAGMKCLEFFIQQQEEMGYCLYDYVLLASNSLDFAMEKELLSSEALQNPCPSYEYNKYM